MTEDSLQSGNVMRYQSGDILPGSQKLVAPNPGGLPWPTDVMGNIYPGCVVDTEGALYDSRSGHTLGDEARVMRRNNFVFNYDGLYKPNVSAESVWRTLFCRMNLAAAMELATRDEGRPLSDMTSWDALEPEKRTLYLEQARMNAGVTRYMVPPDQYGVIEGMDRPVRPASDAELRERTALRESQGWQDGRPPDDILTAGGGG